MTTTATALPVIDLPLPAYDVVLEAESHALRDGKDENIVSSRVVGHLLLELYAQRGILGDKPFQKIAEQVMLQPQDRKRNVVFELGELYRTYLLRAFWTPADLYSAPSPDSPGSPNDDPEAETVSTTGSPENDCRIVGRKALARDGFRCMVTGLFDENSLKHKKGLRGQWEGLGGAPFDIQACYILNESVVRGIGEEEITARNEGRFTAGIIAILWQFGLEDLAVDLKRTNGVYQTWNLLSLCQDLHTWFGNLNLWFKATDEPNRYRVCFSHASREEYVRCVSNRPETSDRGLPMMVSFSSDCPSTPPPDRKLLVLHAVCAQVAHKSGAVRSLGELELDAEETPVLAFDGSSARLLSNLLSVYAAVPGVVAQPEVY